MNQSSNYQKSKIKSGMSQKSQIAHRQFLSSSACVSFFTLISRILGYFRDIIILNWVGIGAITDAYILATKFPSLFRKVISDGSMNNLLIPMLKDIKIKQQNEKSFIMQLSKKLFMRIFIVVSLFLLLIKPLSKIIFTNLSNLSQEFFVIFSYFIFPSLLFMGLSSIWMSLLNHNKKFFASAVSSVICNIIAIITLLISYKYNFSFLFIGIAILFGNIAQFLWISFNVYKHNLLYNQQSSDNFQSEMKIFNSRFLNISFSSGISQIMIMFSSWFASFLPTGNISYLAFADRIMQVPLSLIGIIFSTTFLLYLTQYIKDKEFIKAKKLYNKVWLYGFIVSCVISLFIFLFAYQICKILFLRGKMTANDIYNISMYLKIYILSVPAYTLSKTMNAVFFAYGDTKTPLKGAAIQFASNIILIPTLFYMGSIGISISFLASAWIYTLFMGVNMRISYKFTV